MAEEADPKDGAAAPADEIKNLKAEFSRKTENITAQLAAQNQQIDAVLKAVSSFAVTKKGAQNVNTPEEDSEGDINIDPIDDPKRYAKEVIKRATKQATEGAMRASNESSRAAQEQQAVLTNLVSDYPELNDSGSELHKRALELAKQMPESYRSTKVGITAAVREAAAELGVMTVSRRPKDNSNDDFSVDSGRDSAPRRKSGKDGELDPRTKAFAELIGRPVDDPKYIESLKKASSRKNWNKWG